MCADTPGFGDGNVVEPWNDVDLVGSILHLVVEEVDDAYLGVANHRRQFRESIEPDFDIVLQLFQHVILVPAQLTITA